MMNDEEKQKWRDLHKKEGLVACREKAGGNLDALFVCEDLDYSYFVREARAIVEQLEKGTFVDLAYIVEKMRSIVTVGQIKYRYDDEKRKFWDDLYEYLLGRKKFD